MFLLLLLPELLGPCGSVELPTSSASIALDSSGGSSIIRSEDVAKPHQHRGHVKNPGTSKMSIQVLSSAHQHVEPDSLYTETHPSAEPPQSLLKDISDVLPPLELLPAKWRDKLKHFTDTQRQQDLHEDYVLDDAAMWSSRPGSFSNKHANAAGRKSPHRVPVKDGVYPLEDKHPVKDGRNVMHKDAAVRDLGGNDDSSVNNADDDEDRRIAQKRGFETRSDELQKAHERGYKWKQEHDARDETDDDDWDDKDAAIAIASPDNAIPGDDDDDPDDVDPNADSMSIVNVVPEVNVTAEQDASVPNHKGPLKAIDPSKPIVAAPENNVEKLGEGIGAMAYERSPTGSRSVDHELTRRLQYQDVATIFLLFVIFGLTIILSCVTVYQVADDQSPAAYYSNPRPYQQRLISETNETDAFLAAFNTQPQNVRLRIIGKNPEPGGFRRFLRNLNPHTMRPNGLAALLPVRQRRRLPVLFDVALDLTPFISGEGRLTDESLVTLQKYLNTKNRLETILIQKHVDWDVWEDFSTNIKQKFRTLGFPGDVEVRFEAYDEILIYQNHKWSNFVRNRVTQALVVISIFGSVFWVPYVYIRSRTVKVQSRFRISVDPSRYWDLITDGLSAAEGFHAT